MKQKLLSLLTAGVLLFSVAVTGCDSAPKSEYDDGTMRSEMTAMDFAKEMGVGINLGNTMEAYWLDESKTSTGSSTINENTPQDYETCWGAVVTTQECIDGMKAAGFNTIRVPVYWGNMMKDDGKYQISGEYMDRVQEIVEYCRKAGVYTVINMHHYDEFLIKHHTKEETLKAVEIVWKQIAERFKDYSDYLMFEGFNEALGSAPEGVTLTEDEAYAYVNDMNRVFVETVRSTGGNNAKRMLIVSGYWTNIDNTTRDKFVLPEDTAEDRMMVSVHYIDNSMYWMERVGGTPWTRYSERQCDLLKAAFTDKGIPVFVGECTGIYDAQYIADDAIYTASSDCLSVLLNMAVDYGFVPVIWDVNNGFYSRTDCRIKSESDQAVITALAERIAG